MYKLTRFSHFLTILLLIAFCTVCTNKKSVEEKEYGTATKALIEILENNPDVKSMLESSLEKARQMNPDKKTNPVQSLDEYYDFRSKLKLNQDFILFQPQLPVGSLVPFYCTLFNILFIHDTTNRSRIG